MVMLMVNKAGCGPRYANAHPKGKVQRCQHAIVRDLCACEVRQDFTRVVIGSGLLRLVLHLLHIYLSDATDDTVV